MDKDWVEIHSNIKKIVEKQNECVNIIDIAKKIKLEVEVTRQHFEVMKMDGYGNFMDKEKKIFCTMNNPVEVFNYITKDEIKNQIRSLG